MSNDISLINLTDNNINKKIFNKKWKKNKNKFKINSNLIFSDIYIFYEYIKSESIFDGYFWKFLLIKDNYKIIFMMRTIELIYETIYNYHTTIDNNELKFNLKFIFEDFIKI